MRTCAALLPCLLCVAAAVGQAAAADRVFDLARKSQQVTRITTSATEPTAEALAGDAGARRAAGVVAELSAQQVTELCAAVATKAPSERKAATARPVCYVHISGPAGSTRVVIEQDQAGVYTAADVEPNSKLRRALLRTEIIDRVLGNVGFLGSLSAKDVTDPLGQVFEVAPPFQCGPLLLDSATVTDRLGTGGISKFEPVSRELAKEKFFARLPKGYAPATPAGLLVWVNAGPSGQPPEGFAEALDARGIICIGAEGSGNDRDVTDRMQLALDAVNTARRRWNIDPSRIYASGLSGGAKVACMLVICMPDVFTGGVPIVGAAFYEVVPTGDQGKSWAALFSRPAGRRWEQLLKRRLAMVTGARDFNRPSVTAATKLFQRDKIDAKLFDLPELGHELPPPAAFAEQLAWVDTPLFERVVPDKKPKK